jgi:hypothetical protein
MQRLRRVCGSCTPTPGTYTVVFTAAASNGSSCPPAPASQMVTIGADAGPNGMCNCSGGALTCTGMSTNDAGMTTDESDVFMFTSTGFTGSVTFSQGALSCKYTFVAM